MDCKITSSKRRQDSGSVLFLTLLVTAIIGFTLASYLSLVSAQTQSIQRSQTWNAVMPLVEAGIEEAMAHLNQGGTTNLSSDGWGGVAWWWGSGLAIKQRTLGNGRYVVSITRSTRPIIECTAYVPAPVALVKNSTLSTFFADILSGSMINQPGEVYRSVRVQTDGGALFGKGMVAKGSLDMHGNNVTTDSYDSLDPNFSTNGQYDAAKRKDNGDVATNSGEPNVLNSGNANIMGHVATGPGGTVSVGSNGSVGDIAWVTGGNQGIEAGFFSDDMNMSFPDVTVPNCTDTPGGGTIATTNFTFGSNLVTTSTFPSPAPSGPVTTNSGTITTPYYPSGFVIGAVVTNVLTVTSSSYPTNAIGAVTTNTLIVTTNAPPDQIPATPIVTNTVWVTNALLPSPVPSGTITTSTVNASVRYPYTPMPPGPPSNSPAWVPPSAGTYVGTVTNRYVSTGQQSGRGWWHDYRAISSYGYYAKSYTYSIPNSYTYRMYTYSYSVPSSYSYYQVTSTNISVVSAVYDLILDSRNYVVDSLSGSVYVRGNATIYVRNNISFTGKGGITIGSAGSLVLYMAGTSTTFGGNGVANQPGIAAKFIYYGLTNNTDISFSGNAQVCGAIYAPYANLALNGGGNNNLDFMGACVVSTVSVNGKFNFHYDEDLGRNGPQSRYMVTSWNEVAPDDTRVISIIKGLNY